MESVDLLLEAGLIKKEEDQLIRLFNNYKLKNGQEFDCKELIKDLDEVYHLQDKIIPGKKKFNKIRKKTSADAAEGFHITCLFPNLDSSELGELKLLLDDLYKSFTLMGLSADSDNKPLRTYFLGTSIVEI